MYKYRLWLYYYNLKGLEVLRGELVDEYELRDSTTVIEECKEIYRLTKEAKQLIRAIENKMNFDFSRAPEGTDTIKVRLEEVNCYIAWTKRIGENLGEDLAEELIRL